MNNTNRLHSQILISIDDSNQSNQAADYATSLAEKYKAHLVNHADCEKIDLIVVGTKGRSGLKRLLLGSIA